MGENYFNKDYQKRPKKSNEHKLDKFKIISRQNDHIRQTDIKIDRQTKGQTDIKMDRRTDRQKDK